MQSLRFILILLGALAVLALGSAPTAAETPPPCHAMEHQAPDHPDKPIKAMTCCVACVAAVAPRPALPAALPDTPSAPAARPLPLRVGLTPAPEPGPPRA